MKRRHSMPFGADWRPEATRFRLWAPAEPRVELVLRDDRGERLLKLTAGNHGWHQLTVEHVPVLARYGYRLGSGLTVPDPASRFNPDDVHGLSAVVDPHQYDWTDDGWRGRPWHEAVIYELHVGTFTPEGTFAAVEQRFDYLLQLGVTAIELMPLADFPGKRNWGYDGVLLYAPDASYGTPADLKRLVDAAHRRGLMVLLDVVYNHFGPDGNYLHAYAPQFFSERHHTPWGAAINYDGEHSRSVRDFMIHNALYWLQEFHFDGLRFDAVHAIADDSSTHLIEELAASVRSHVADRHVHLVLENDHNEARWFHRERAHADAQWNDDVHHAAHVLVTGETDGYYIDYADEPARRLARGLTEGFIYQGEPSPYRNGRRRGSNSTSLPSTAFVNYTQTHDQVGNRAFGERLSALTRWEPLRAVVGCVLLSPSIPMLFMGEEFAASSPFRFFCDFDGELAAAVTQGRRKEFERFERFRDPAVQAQIPDPNAAETFDASKLDWDETSSGGHAEVLAFYRECLQLRHQQLMPRLPARPLRHSADGRLIRMAWELADRSQWHIVANLGEADAVDVDADADADAGTAATQGRTVYTVGTIDGKRIGPWSLRVTATDAA